jgi:C1A family cysteine protease
MSVINNGIMPPKTDLRDYRVKSCATDVSYFQLDNLPEVKDQGSVGSCGAHSSSSILEWFNTKETGEYRRLSVGFIYGMQGVACDRIEKGMYLRDACKIIQQYGDCLHDTMSLNLEMPWCYHQLKKILNDEVYKEAAIAKIKSYARCTTNDAIKHALTTYGPVLMSIKWYDEYTLDDDVIQFNTDSDIGNHGIMVYGFNDKGWLCQNSWGKAWGNNGRFVLPYEHGFIEAWSFVDAENSDIYKPTRNAWLDILYKVLNFIINLVKGLGSKNVVRNG